MRIRHGLALAFVVLALAAVSRTTLRAADPVWTEVRSPHFLLFTDTSEAKGRRLLEDLESRVATLSGVLGEIPAREFPVEVLLFSKHEDFLEAAPKPTGPDAPLEFEKSAYLLRGPDRVFLVARDKSPSDIAEDAGHALGHVFFERGVFWRPFWLAEGTAEYFRKAGRSPDLKVVSPKDAYPVEDLLEIIPSRDYDDALPASAFRIQSHRLLRLVASDHNTALREFLQRLRTEGGNGSKLDVDSDALQPRFDMVVETRIELRAAGPIDIKARVVPSTMMAIRRGDILLAAKKTSEAGDWYRGESPEAVGARAILARFLRSGGTEAPGILSRAAREVPDHALLAFHFGSLEMTKNDDIQLQIRALERVVERMPRFGRAHAQLARVEALAAQGSSGQQLRQDTATGVRLRNSSLARVDRALEIEPEFADEFFAARAEVLLAWGRHADAMKAIQTAALLQRQLNLGNKAGDYGSRADEIARRIERIREETESRNLERIRSEVAVKVAEREPPPPPPPPPAPERSGSVQYSVQSSRQTSVVSAPLPYYPEALIQKGIGGNITIRATIDVAGKVVDAAVLETQFQDMTAATLAAVKKWTFAATPGTGRGAAVTPLEVRIVFRFTIQATPITP